MSDRRGETVFLAPPLATFRVDETGTLWIRPVVGGYRPEPGKACSVRVLLQRRPRRALDPVSVRREDIEFYSGEVARIRLAGLETLPELQPWDSFYLLALTAQEEAEFDALWADSYLGGWA